MEVNGTICTVVVDVARYSASDGSNPGWSMPGSAIAPYADMTVCLDEFDVVSQK